MSTYRHINLHTLAEIEASGNSHAFPVTGAKVGLVARVTAKEGTNPTLDFELEWSADGANFVSAASADTLVQLTDVGGEAKSYDAKAPWARLAWAIGGTATPKFTFEAQAVVA